MRKRVSRRWESFAVNTKDGVLQFELDRQQQVARENSSSKNAIQKLGVKPAACKSAGEFEAIL